eukprot:CAMPEP_0168387616 /NCGR_PEP_ID=MMETSP0228-20121227/16035_1 /TAXON_ID=133427 /ORGANISM="Protoceratium reticulatum, Strain CCCM 535 (=CCMP 1889)" /LENGTH=66 /DNA_ID=CAMNT_0008400853 /DNA_START=104 /DNA_END=300 /DNA_ORIENTATION=-
MLSAFAVSMLCASLGLAAAGDSCQVHGHCEMEAVKGATLLQKAHDRKTMTGELSEAAPAPMPLPEP